jgi:hypothetical protein
MRIQTTIESSALLNPLDLHSSIKRKDVTASTKSVVADGKSVGMAGKIKLDWASWLPFAAKQYNISPNVEDYILVPVFTIPTDLPNRNGVGFPLEQLVRFNPEYGMQAYKTFKGKPTFEEHVNEDYTKAKGVIADVFMRKMPKYGIWKMLELLTFDRTRDPDLCRDILKGDLNSYSMGAWVDAYTCSYCGAEMGKCGHLHPKSKVDFYQLGDTLVYRKVVNPVGFETSAVRIPAYTVAVDTGVMSLNDADLLEPRVRPRSVV